MNKILDLTRNQRKFPIHSIENIFRLNHYLLMGQNSGDLFISLSD